MKQKISSTIEPDNPIEDFNSWYQHIILQREQEGEIRRYKREVEVSFDVLHNSMTQSNFKRQ